MIKSGIMVRNLDMSQFGVFLMDNVNSLLDEYGDNLDILVFYEGWGKLPMSPRFCSLMEREVWGLDGVVMSTDIKTTQRLIQCPGPTKKFFYVWNLEWLGLQQNGVDYSWLHDIYCNPAIELVARSNNHARLLEKIWKKPAFIMEDFDKTVLKEILT